MKLNDNPLMIILGIILIILGIGAFFGLLFLPGDQYMIIAVFALAGLLVLLAIIAKPQGFVGTILMAAYLVLIGLIAQFQLSFVYSGVILTLLPLGAGVFLLMGL